MQDTVKLENFDKKFVNIIKDLLIYAKHDIHFLNGAINILDGGIFQNDNEILEIMEKIVVSVDGKR